MKNKKMLALLLSAVLLIGAVAGGTLAWLTDTTDEVVNTFTVGNIEIELDETTGDTYKMIPGWTITKDPVATVLANSEDCYLFVKLEETGVSFVPEGETMPKVYSFEDFLTYTVASDWTPLDGESGVYYRMVEKRDADQDFAVLEGNKVTVKDTVTKEMMDDLTDYQVNPTLTVTAYACQLYSTNGVEFGAENAWKAVNGIS